MSPYYCTQTKRFSVTSPLCYYLSQNMIYLGNYFISKYLFYYNITKITEPLVIWTSRFLKRQPPFHIPFVYHATFYFCKCEIKNDCIPFHHNGFILTYMLIPKTIKIAAAVLAAHKSRYNEVSLLKMLIIVCLLYVIVILRKFQCTNCFYHLSI